MAQPGKAEEGRAIRPQPVPDYIRLSPYYDPFDVSDDVTKGVRLNYEKVQERGQLPGVPITVSKGSAALGGGFSYIILNFPEPPALATLQLWERISQTKIEATGLHFPFLEWKDYKYMLGWLNYVMVVDHDESYWYPILKGDPDMARDLGKLALVMCTFWRIGVAYATINKQFGRGFGFKPITKEEWKYQADIQPISGVEDYVDKVIRLLATLPHPPNYTPPPEQVFTRIGNYIASGKNVTMAPNIMPYLYEVDTKVANLLVVYSKAYPSLFQQLSSSHRSVNALVCEALFQHWCNFVGLKIAMHGPYSLLRQKWGTPKPPEKVKVIILKKPDAIIVHLPLAFPGPSAHMSVFMKEFDDQFNTSSDPSIPISWIMETGKFFNESGFTSPYPDIRDWMSVYTKLQDPTTMVLWKPTFERVIYEFYRVVQLCKSLSENWKLSYEEWIWDSQGYSKEQREMEKAGANPYSPKEAHRRWPNPELLDDKAMNEYLDYSVPMPGFRKQALLEDAYSYNLACKASEEDYWRWRNKIFVCRKALATYPIGCSISVVIDGKNTTIRNYYADYGVWDYPTDSPWRKLIGGFLQPWKSLTGKDILDDMLDRVRKVYQVLWPMLDNIMKDVGDTFNKVALAMMGIGIVGIFALKEIGNVNNKKELP